MAERLLDHDAGLLIDTPCGLESLGDSSEKNRRNGQIMDRTLGSSEGLLERLERGGIAVVAIDILESIRKLLEDLLIDPAAIGGDPLAGAVDDLLARHATLGNTDDRPLQHPPAVKRLDGVEEFLMGQVSRGSEEDEGVAFE